MTTHFIAIDLVKIYKTTEKKSSNLRTVLAWGDEVEVLETKATHIKIALTDFVNKPDGSILQTQAEGFILKSGSGGPALDTIVKPIAD